MAGHRSLFALYAVQISSAIAKEGGKRTNTSVWQLARRPVKLLPPRQKHAREYLFNSSSVPRS